MDVLEKAVEIVRERFGEDLLAVILYGSHALGRAHDLSDVNLVTVVQELPPPGRERRHLVGELTRRFLWEAETRLSPVLLTAEEFRQHLAEASPLALGVSEGYRVLYGRAGELDAFYEALRRSYEFDPEVRAWKLREPS